MPRLLENPPSQGNSNPFSFVIVSQPSAERDKEVRRQVRSHAANSWRGISRQRTPRQTRLRRIVPKAELSTEQRLTSLEARGLSFLHGDEDGPHPQQPAISRALTSPTITFTQRSPSPGASPKTYLGGGRMDPFNTCSVQCNTMESFLLDHCESSHVHSGNSKSINSDFGVFHPKGNLSLPIAALSIYVR